MPDRVDVALAILTLVLAVVAVIGRLLLGMLAWGERLLLALQRPRTPVHEPWQEHDHVPNLVRPNPQSGKIAGRRLALVVGRQQQKLAALTFIDPRRADNHQGLLPHAVKSAQQTWRRFDDRWAVTLQEEPYLRGLAICKV